MQENPAAIFELADVKKIYPMGGERVVALNGISLQFHRGQVYCLLGTSGSGKSTLLNLLAGLEKPTRGSIKFMGKPLETLNETQLALYRQKYVGFVFQSYNLLPTLTALENVTLPLMFKKTSRRVRVQAAKSMLAAVGLGKRMRHKPAELSGGQQQRVSIARAFVNKPRVVFADEPTGNLDTKTTFEMMELITKMARENGQTLIIVTHEVELALYANQVIQIRDGIVEKVVDKQVGQPFEQMSASAVFAQAATRDAQAVDAVDVAADGAPQDPASSTSAEAHEDALLTDAAQDTAQNASTQEASAQNEPQNGEDTFDTQPHMDA